jgi:hypothetical protein
MNPQPDRGEQQQRERQQCYEWQAQGLPRALAVIRLMDRLYVACGPSPRSARVTDA